MTGKQRIKYYLVQKWYNFIFIDLDCLEHNLKITNPERVQKAKDDAASAGKPVLPGLKSTETNHKWVLLYDHARQVQLRPRTLRRMYRRDLQYLAGMTFAHPDLVAPKGKKESQKSAELRHAQATKMQGNAARAQNELKSRDIIRTGFLAALTAIVGALMTAVFTEILRAN
jgi:hypothetical protein